MSGATAKLEGFPGNKMTTFGPLTHYRRDLIVVFALALMVHVLAALPQTQPGYMDAAYYTVGGQQLVQGFGFNDPYIWNYLDQPMTLPHPSHLYWMPLPSILVAISQSIFGVNYRAAQLPFVMLASLLPLIAYAIAWRVSSSRRQAWLAALLTIFSPFYLPYWGVPESFAPFAVFGSLALLLSQPGNKGASWRLVMAGVCAGLAHLSRADGLLLLVPMVVVNAESRSQNTESRKFYILSSSFCILAGYFAVMLPWFIRNLAVIGSPLSSSGTQLVWACNYDELYSFGLRLDFNHWLNCGIDRVLLDKLQGLGSGLIHLLAEDGSIFLAPLMVISLWRSRRSAIFQAALVYLVLLYLAMTLVFTFAGDRGGLFHSSGALLPFLCAAATIGLDTFVGWIAARRRTWHTAQARSIFGAGLVGMALLLSLIVWRGRVIGPNAADPVWNQSDRVYSQVKQWFSDRGEKDPIVMANSPPEFFYHTGLRSIVIPSGDVTALLQAADRFEVRWLLIDPAQAHGLDGFFVDNMPQPRLRHAADFGTTALYVVTSIP